MQRKKKVFKKLSTVLAIALLVSVFSVPSFAATKTQTRTGVGANSSAVDATMTFQLNTNGTVSNGKVTKVVKNSSFWFCVYNNHSKSAYRYNSNKNYGAHTSGLWALPGEKGGIVNINVTGFR